MRFLSHPRRTEGRTPNICVQVEVLLILEIHFSTETIVDDMQALLDGGVGRNKAKCRLRSLLAGVTPLKLDLAGFQTIEAGLSIVLPHIKALV